MTAIIALIDQVAVGIYFLIAAGILFSLRRYIIFGEEYRSSYFELERDLARYRRLNAVTAIIFLIEIAIIVAGIQVVVVPELWRDRQIAGLVARTQPDDGEFATPAPAPPAENLGIEPVPLPRSAGASVQIQATPRPSPTAVGTIIPSDPAEGCDTPEAQLLIPGNGMRVFQPIPVVGTAYTDQFSFATIEINGPSTFGNFQVITTVREIRETTEISQFVPALYENGEYQLRLMVYDIANELKASCLVHIYISEPLPTLTPVR